jgi:hypothetical protein
LPLDNVQRDTFSGHLDGVGVSELVGREASAYPGGDGELAQGGTGGAW